LHRIAQYVERRVEQLVQQRVDKRVREINHEMKELAVATRKAIAAMAEAINSHDELIRQLAKRDETDLRPDNQRSLRVVN
jgi:hypothetical protein